MDTRRQYQNWKLSERRRRIKQKAVEYKGGSCERCGYNKSNAAMDFHHIDPNEKDCSVSHISNKKWEYIKEELDKCQLLCATCHREVHEEINIQESIEKEKYLRQFINVIEPVFVKCATCGKEKKVQPSRLKKYAKHYCNKKCRFPKKKEKVLKGRSHLRKVERPSKEELLKLIESNTWVSIGKKFGVSDNTIRNWAKIYNLIDKNKNSDRKRNNGRSSRKPATAPDLKSDEPLKP